jgi:penicillin-binding protein 2
LKEEPLTLEERRLFNRRDIIIKLTILVPFTNIAVHLWDLQVRQGANYKELAKGNRIRLKSVPAPRGIIYDRQGIKLAKNIPSYNLMLVREDTDDIEAVLKKISTSLKIPVKSMRKALLKKKRLAKFQPVLIKKDLTHYQMAVISAYQEEFPGVTIEAYPLRYYPNLQSGAHSYGYMAAINKEQLKRLPANKVKSAQKIGQEGIEMIYNDQLIGTDGGLQVEVDSAGRVLRTLNSIDPLPGNDIHLNVDTRLQREVERIFRDRRGAAIIMETETGAIRSMVSLPSFDPNEFSRGISAKRWDSLVNDPSHQLSNRCIHGTFSPGSTFKMLVGIAALEEGIIDARTEHLCKGYYTYNKLRVHCWKRSGHGNLNIARALENSCNVFFYKVAMELGVDTIRKYALRFGFGKLTNVDLFNEKSGLIPSRKWKLKRFAKKWYPGETLPVGIGQGFVSVTPMQLAVYTNSIANGGTFISPRLVNSISVNQQSLTPFGSVSEKVPPLLEVERRKIDVSKKTLEIIKKGMELNVSGRSGTGKNAKSSLVKIAGKTGTTQVVSIKTKQKIIKERGEIPKKYLNHAWFTSYAPSYNPKITVVVLLENGESGSNAATLAKEIIEFYFSEISPLPSSAERTTAKSATNQQVT